MSHWLVGGKIGKKKRKEKKSEYKGEEVGKWEKKEEISVVPREKI